MSKLSHIRIILEDFEQKQTKNLKVMKFSFQHYFSFNRLKRLTDCQKS
jgi:hypothetical protein